MKNYKLYELQIILEILKKLAAIIGITWNYTQNMEVFYSIINNIVNLHESFKLITGIEEFLKFGISEEDNDNFSNFTILAYNLANLVEIIQNEIEGRKISQGYNLFVF